MGWNVIFLTLMYPTLVAIGGSQRLVTHSSVSHSWGDLWPLTPNSPWWGCVPRWRGRRDPRRPLEREPPSRIPERPGGTGYASWSSSGSPRRTFGNKTRRNRRKRPPCSRSTSLPIAPAGPAENPSGTESPQAQPQAPLTCWSNAGNVPLQPGWDSPWRLHSGKDESRREKRSRTSLPNTELISNPLPIGDNCHWCGDDVWNDPTRTHPSHPHPRSLQSGTPRSRRPRETRWETFPSAGTSRSEAGATAWMLYNPNHIKPALGLKRDTRMRLAASWAIYRSMNATGKLEKGIIGERKGEAHWDPCVNTGDLGVQEDGPRIND